MHTVISLSLEAARRALEWRLPVLVGAALLPPLAMLVAPAWFVLDAQLSYSVHAAALAQQLDLASITDLLAVGRHHALAAQLALAAALACTALLSPLLAGATVTAARSPAPLPFRALVEGGVAHYARMARMLLWCGVLLAAALWLGSFLSGLAQPGEAVLPTDGATAQAMATIVTGLLVWAVLVTVDAGRAVLAADRRRTSAIGAWWDGMALLRQRPLETLGSYALLGLIGFGVVGALGLARLHFPTGALPGALFRDLAALALTQLIAVALAWFRAARLFALVKVAMTVTRP